MKIHDDIASVLIGPEELAARVTTLGEAISADYAGKAIVLVGVLKGALLFMADLARCISVPLALDFMSVSSYGDQTSSQGVVRILKDLDQSIDGKHILLVEDIIDSGLTLHYLLDLLQQRHPASLRVCALLDKSTARVKTIPLDYTGFMVPDEFVVGYGLDYAQRYRNLPYIGILKPEVYKHH